MIAIRKVSHDDCEVVSKLLTAKYSFATIEEARTTFKWECEYSHFRVAEQCGEIVGIIAWRPQGMLRHGVVEVTRLAINRDIVNPSDVQEMLFDVMVAEADYYYKQHGEKLRKVFSMIHADCSHIKDLFLNKGMRQEALLHDHFHRGKDELVFSLFLT